MKIPSWAWAAGAILLALVLTGGTVVTANYLSAAWMASQNAQKWGAALGNAEDSYGIPSGLLARIAYQESHFVQSIIDGTQASPAGALGLMQLMPQYFSTVNRPIPFSDNDTQDQINEAAGQLVNLYNQFGNWTDAVAGYNAGAGTIGNVLAGSAVLPAETASYIASISRDLPGIVNPTLSA